jgi:hypothetical protein
MIVTPLGLWVMNLLEPRARGTERKRVIELNTWRWSHGTGASNGNMDMDYPRRQPAGRRRADDTPRRASPFITCPVRDLGPPQPFFVNSIILFLQFCRVRGTCQAASDIWRSLCSWACWTDRLCSAEVRAGPGPDGTKMHTKYVY